jgi:NADH:ubiquinone oxidoreductase subunit E
MDQDVKEKELELANIVEDAIQKHGATQDAVIPILSEINRALGYVPRGIA